ncbi:MAG: insulinase family protein [Candidatus Eisenbacteria bacterium]|uniref:Insulinase family protein n=1 Tax=Eiseniibacteriota bacterium TaxID=2212470 RepID=A0A849STJ4_UNCEI|nr:insulinase family protein [Candidatus Eisenbacteria bacterium]
MLRRCLVRAALAAFAAVALLSSRGALAAAPAHEVLTDSTVIERWTMANGLRVVTRSIRGAEGVAVTLAYRYGRRNDPATRPGLAQVVGHLAFTAPAGELPGRTLEDLDSQRPYGWSFPVMQSSTLLTEVASLQQFPGVLAEVARRMRGVTVDAASLKRAVEQVRAELKAEVDGPRELVMGALIRDVALGRSAAASQRRTSGRGLDGLTIAEVRATMSSYLQPGNAVLCLVGDFNRVEVRRPVESLFGGIPAGPALPPPPPADSMHASARVFTSAGVRAIGIGLLAPPLDDTLHAAYFMTVSLAGSMADQIAKSSGQEDKPRFQYALFDEPELGRLYPDLPSDSAAIERAGEAVSVLMAPLADMTIPKRSFDVVRDRLAYLMGGPMPPGLRQSLRANPRLMITASRGIAACELLHGPEFWAAYRTELMETNADEVRAILPRVLDPAYQVRVAVLSGAGGAKGARGSR